MPSLPSFAPSTSLLPSQTLHIIALHVLHSHGFYSTTRVASLTLAHALEKYLILLARDSRERAEDAGRVSVGFEDVRETLRDVAGWSATEDDLGIMAGTGDEYIEHGGMAGVVIGEGWDAEDGVVNFDGMEQLKGQSKCDLRALSNNPDDLCGF